MSKEKVAWQKTRLTVIEGGKTFKPVELRFRELNEASDREIKPLLDDPEFMERITRNVMERIHGIKPFEAPKLEQQHNILSFFKRRFKNRI